LYSGVLPAGEVGNLQTTAPGLVEMDNYDYHLTSQSPAVDGGVDPGSANGIVLTPKYEYKHPSSRVVRMFDGMIDIGAYELSR
jgi:hypothetical protein